MEYFCFAVGWLIVCALIGALASERGRDPILWTIIAFFISPLLAGIFLFVMADQKAQRPSEMAYYADLSQRTAQARAEFQAAETRRVAEGREAEAKRVEALRVSGADFALTIERLRQLHEKKVYSDIEFVTHKRKAMQELGGRILTEPPEQFLAALIPLIEIGALDETEVSTLKTWVFSGPSVAQSTANTPAQVSTRTPASPNHPRARTWEGYVCAACGTSAPIAMNCDQCGRPMSPG